MRVAYHDERLVSLALPPLPLRISEPVIDIPQIYALLGQNAHRTPAVRSLRRAWVQPALGAPYLPITPTFLSVTS